MAFDLGKLVRVETLFCDITEYLKQRKEAEPELKDHYGRLWLEGMAKHKADLLDHGVPTYTFLGDFGKGAAAIFSDIARTYFPKIELSHTEPAQATYYVMLLHQAQTLDMMAYLSIADKVWQDVDHYYQGTIVTKVKTQLDDKGLKQYFLEQYDELFREKGYVVLNHQQLREQAFAHYLFLLAGNKIEEVIKRQLPGMEQVTRYVDKKIILPQPDDNKDDNNTGSRS